MSKTTRPLSSKSSSKQMIIPKEEVVMGKTTNYGGKDHGNVRIEVLERKIKVDSKNHENEKEKIIKEKDRDISSLEAKNESLLSELDMKTEKIRQLDLSNKKKDNQLQVNHYYTEKLKKEYESLKKRADTLEKIIEEKCRQQEEIVQSNDENKVSMEAQIRSLKKELDLVKAEKVEQEKKIEQLQLDAKDRDQKWKEWKERIERQEEKSVEKENEKEKKWEEKEKENDKKWEERMDKQVENAVENEKEKEKKWEEKEKEKDKKWEERMKRQVEIAVEKEKEKEKKWEEKEKEKDKKWEERMKRQVENAVEKEKEKEKKWEEKEKEKEKKWEERMRLRDELWERRIERVIAEANKRTGEASESTREFQNNTETVVLSHQNDDKISIIDSKNIQFSNSKHYYGRQYSRRQMGNISRRVQPQSQFKLPTDLRSTQNRRGNYVSSKLPSYKN
ncbi:uncharacterized protein LOC144620607 [Crassostrea virginica]